MDFSQMTDEELMAMEPEVTTPSTPEVTSAPEVTSTPEPQFDLSQLSDEELINLNPEPTMMDEAEVATQPIREAIDTGVKSFIRVFDESKPVGKMQADGIAPQDFYNSTIEAIKDAPVEEGKAPPLITNEQGETVWRIPEIRDKVLGDLGFDEEFIQAQPAGNAYTIEEQDEVLEFGLLGPVDALIGAGVFSRLAGFVGQSAMKLARNRTIRRHLEKISADPEAYEEATALIKFMEDQDVHFTNVFIQGTKASNVEQYMSKENLFATRDILYDMEKMGEASANFLIKTINKLKTQDIDISKVSTWEEVNKAGSIIANEVRDHRLKLKKQEFTAWEATKPLLNKDKTLHKVSDKFKKIEKNLVDDGVPPEAVNATRNILNRFGKPYADETKKLKGLKDQYYRMTAEVKKLRADQKELNKSDSPDAMQKSALVEGQIAKKREALKNNVEAQNELKDVKYMELKDLYATIKLINRKLYKPGGSISTKDMDELRGLQIAKTHLMDITEELSTDPKLKELLGEAKNITKLRAFLYGAKDTGGEKMMLAQLLEIGDYKQASNFITGPSGLENVMYLKKTLGVESEGYKSATKLYLLDKLGLSKDKISEVMTKPAGQSFESVDFQKMSNKLNSLTAKDYNLITDTYGKEISMEMQAAGKVLAKYEQIQKTVDEGNIGLKYGKTAYIEGADGVLDATYRLSKLTKDAVTYKLGQTASKVVQNQPKFRVLTGAMVSEAAYLYNVEDKDLSVDGVIASAVVGGLVGYQAGRATRSLLESDAKKWVRYIKSGRFAPNKAESAAIKRLDEFNTSTGEEETVEPLGLMDTSLDVIDYIPAVGAVTIAGKKGAKHIAKRLKSVTDDLTVGAEKYVDDILHQDKLLKTAKQKDDYFGKSTGIHDYSPRREHPLKEIYVTGNTQRNVIDREVDYSKWYDAIEDYTSMGYEDVNWQLRHKTASPLHKGNKVLKFLDEAPENFDGIVYRGSRATPEQQAMIEGLEEGSTLTNKTPLSTSVDFEAGRAFATYDYEKNIKPVMLTIKGKGHDIAHASTNFDEAEVLMKPGKVFRLNDKIETNTQIQLVLEEVHPDIAKLYKSKAVEGVLGVGGLSVIGATQDEEPKGQ